MLEDGGEQEPDDDVGKVALEDPRKSQHQLFR